MAEALAQVLEMRRVRSMPPAVATVLEALAELRPADPESAAVHLVTARADVLGMALRLGLERLEIRGCSVVRPGSIAGTARAARELAVRTAGAADEFLDLRTAPETWLKPVRSGARVVLFGTDVLFGAPLLSVAVEVATPAVLAELGRRAAGGASAVSAGLSGQLLLADGPVRLRGDSRLLRVDPG